MSELFYYGPSNGEAEIDLALAEKMPYGEEAVKHLIVPEWKTLAEVNPTLIEEWNKIFGVPEQ